MNQVIQTGSACSACLILLVLAQATTAADNPAGSADDEAKPLSVAPLDHVDYPENRPEWITAPPELKVVPHSWVVVSRPCETKDECDKDLTLMVRASVETYIKSLPDADGEFEFFTLSDEWINDRLIGRKYDGEVTQEGLTRYERAVEVTFDQSARDEVLRSLKNVQVQDRLGALGVLVVTGLLGLIFSSTLLGFASRRVERNESIEVSTM